MRRKERSSIFGIGLATLAGAAAIWFSGAGTGHSLEGVRSPGGLLGATASGGLEQVTDDSCTSTPGTQVQYRAGESHGDLVLRLEDQLAYVESVFSNATPGSPAQFRAREESDSLREQLRFIGCGYTPGNSPR